MEIDVTLIPTDTYMLPNIAASLPDICAAHQRSSDVTRFFREELTDPHGIMECTPDAALLRDDAPPLVLPRTLTLRPHQMAAMDYLVRMERRAARMQSMGTFAQWLPVKRGNQTVWLGLDMDSDDSHVRIRNVPDTRIEYTSRVLCLADESGLGKTVTLIALMLGTDLVMPLDHTNLLCIHTRASIVLVDPLMLKGISDWRSLPGDMYPAARVYVVEQLSDWKALSRRDIRDADMVIMSYPFYMDHYRMSTEYSDPEETTVLSFKWQRLVLDDRHVHNPMFDRVPAWVYYFIHPYPYHDTGTYCLTQTRVQGDTTWCPAWRAGTRIVRYIRNQCTWRRTVRSVSNELARPSFKQTRVPVPMTEHENVIVDALGDQGRMDHYDVPVNYKGIWRTGSTKKCTRVVQVDPTVTVMGAYKSFNSAAPWKSQFGTSSWKEMALQVSPIGSIQRQHGTLVTALLLLLRTHWREHPKEPVLIVCFSVHAVARLAHIFKAQHVPTRTLGKHSLAYTTRERQELKVIGRSRCMVHLVDHRMLSVSVNRLAHLRHVYIFSGTLTPESPVWQSIFRPVAPEDVGAPIQMTSIYPGSSLLLSSAYDQTQQPYCDLNTDAIVIVS